MSEENLQVELNSKEGQIWKQTLMQTEQQIEVGKVNAEIQEVVLEYCKKKVKEDQEKIEESLK